LRIDPLQRRGHDRVRGPFALALLDRGAAAESIVVPIESDVQAEPPVERESADEGTGRETASLQLGGQRRPLRVESIAGVVPDSVLVRVAAAENARVRGQRDDGVRVSEGEARATGGQPIEIRCHGAAAIRAEHVSPQRVDGDQQHVAIGVDRERETGGLTRPPPADCRCDEREHGRGEGRPGLRLGGRTSRGLFR
jgi:hypothetical protein